MLHPAINNHLESTTREIQINELLERQHVDIVINSLICRKQFALVQEIKAVLANAYRLDLVLPTLRDDAETEQYQALVATLKDLLFLNENIAVGQQLAINYKLEDFRVHNKHFGSCLVLRKKLEAGELVGEWETVPEQRFRLFDCKEMQIARVLVELSEQELEELVGVDGVMGALREFLARVPVAREGAAA